MCLLVQIIDVERISQTIPSFSLMIVFILIVAHDNGCLFI